MKLELVSTKRYDNVYIFFFSKAIKKKLTNKKKKLNQVPTGFKQPAHEKVAQTESNDAALQARLDNLRRE